MRRTRTRRRAARLRAGRRTDRLEDLAAWALMSLGLFAVLGSVLLGHAAYDAALGRGAPPSPMRAVLLADVPRSPAADQRVPTLQQFARVTWTAADGAVHVVDVRVPPALRAGSAVTVWLDRAGRVVADPARRSAEAVAFGISAALAVIALSWAVLSLLWSTVCRLTAARNAAAWAREWARVEPRWRRSVL
jgi:hypothetical protein